MNLPATTLGIDIGGSKIAAGIATFPEGRPVFSSVIPTRPERGGRAVLDTVAGLARELSARADALGLPVRAVGLGICELVDRQGQIASANCIQWLQLPVREELAAIAPCVIEADVRAAAIAEARWGAGKSFGSFLYVTVGTGIACCLVLDGRPFLGARGLTGTMGSNPLAVTCETCGHLNSRSLEDIAAGPALARQLSALGRHAPAGYDVIAAAISGDPAALQVVDSASQTLGSQVGLLVNVLDPEAVLIGGGLGLSQGPFWDSLTVATRRHIWSGRHRDLPILHAATGADAGWIGAATAAWEAHP